MKKVMSLILGVGLVVAFSGVPAAEPEGGKSTASNPSQQTMEKASPKMMTGRITHVDKNAQTFLIVSDGKRYRFSYGKIDRTYKVGQVVDVSYVVNPSGEMEATDLNLSKSTTH
jgi:hypothetical protein